MAEKYAADWKELFAPGEVILADEGFSGYQSDVAQEPTIITLNKAHQNFGEFASKRILIENVFAKIKRWRACEDVLRTPCSESLLELHHKVWVVVSYLVNKFAR